VRPKRRNDPNVDSGNCFDSIMKQRFTVSASRELWEFVPLDRYVILGDAQNWVCKKRRTLGRLFGPARTEAQSRVRTEDQLCALPATASFG